MQIDYGKMLTLLRKWALAFAGFIFVTVASGFILQLCAEADWYKDAWKTVHVMTALITGLLASTWFHWLGGMGVGFALGIWIDDRLRWLDQHSVKVPKPEKGVLDYRVDLEESGGKFSKLMERVSADIEDIGNKTAKHGAAIIELTQRASRYSTIHYARRSKAVAGYYARDIASFSKRMAASNAKLESQADLMIAAIKWISQHHVAWVDENINDIRGLQDGAIQAREGMIAIIEAMKGSVGHTSELNAAIEKADSEIYKLLSITHEIQMAATLALMQVSAKLSAAAGTDINLGAKI
jgi:hypothetical protein